MLRKSRIVIVLTHSNADVDAVAAACTAAYIAKKIGESAVRIMVPEGIAVDARDCARLCSEVLNTEVEVYRKSATPAIARADLCILVDTATRVQLKNLALVVDRCSAVAVLDHHAERETFPNIVLDLVFPNASSSSELAFLLAKQLNLVVPRELATVLLAGILSDTRRFLRAEASTFRVVAELIELGADYEEALKLSTPRSDVHRSSRIAKIKCVLRHTGFHIEEPELMIAVSEVGAFESHCANLLLSIGYDVALVLTEDDALKAVRVVFRAKSDVVEKAGIDVFNDFLKPLVSEFGGSGGGHRVAGAAIVMRRNIEEVAKAIGRVIRAKFGSKVRELAEERVKV